MSGPDCERMRALRAEVALGIADGADRAWALEHLTGCVQCREATAQMAALADELTLLAPEVEPPAGFEARVAEAIAPAPSRRGFARRMLLPATAALAAACAAGVVWLTGAGDRDIADSYRRTLAVAHGEYFDAAPMLASGGRPVGYVYGYQGRTSWLLGIVSGGLPDGRYRLEAITAGGRRLAVRPLVVTGGRGSAGGATEVGYEDLAEVRLLDAGGHEVAASTVH